MFKKISLLSFLAQVLWATLLTGGLHWLTLEPDEPFLSLRHDEVVTFVVFLLIGVLTSLTQGVKQLDGIRQGWSSFWQNRWVLLVATLILTAISAFALIKSGHEATTRTKVICWAGLILFGGAMVLAIRECIGGRKAPQYDTDQHYLYLLSAFRRTPLEWKHITGFGVVTIERGSQQKCVAVYIDNADELTANASLMTRMACQMWIQKYGTPYIIPTDRCALTPEQICAQLEAELHRHQRC